HRHAVVEVAREVDLGEEERLTPHVARQLAQAAGVVGHEHLVGVQVDEPVAGGGLERDVARLGEVAGPLVVEHRGAEGLRDLHRGVGRAGVHDDHLVHHAVDRLEAAREHLLLVLDDHRQADLHALGGLGQVGDLVGAAGELRQGQRHLRRQVRRHVDLLAAAAGQLVQVRAHVREVRVEALGGLEQALGRLQCAQLVQQHARVVEDHRLARLVLEDRETLARGGEQQRRHLLGGRLRQRGHRALEQRQAGTEAAVGIAVTGGLREKVLVAVEVAAQQVRAREGGQLGGRAADGLGCGCGGEAKSHTGYLPSGQIAWVVGRSAQTLSLGRSSYAGSGQKTGIRRSFEFKYVDRGMKGSGGTVDTAPGPAPRAQAPAHWQSRATPLDPSLGRGILSPSDLVKEHPSMQSEKSRRRISPDEALALWLDYRKTGDSRLRDRLIKTYAPLVKYIVYKKIRELPARCEVEDFISCGLEALINSIDRYDPE